MTDVFIRNCNSETERRKMKASKIRKLMNHNDNEEEAMKSSPKKDNNNGIMIVRTIEDSLNPSPERVRVMKLQRKRRLLKRHLKEFVRDISDEKNLTTQNSFSQSELSSISSSSSLLSSDKFNVNFSIVTIRDYPMIPGDNPSIWSGPPLSIQWNHVSQETFDFEEYEKSRENDRRLASQFKVPKRIRIQILLDHGFSLNEIRQASKQAAIIRRQRIRTIELSKTYAIEELFEYIGRNVMKPFRSREVKRESKHLKQLYQNPNDTDNTSTGSSDMKSQDSTKGGTQFDNKSNDKSSFNDARQFGAEKDNNSIAKNKNQKASLSKKPESTLIENTSTSDELKNEQKRKEKNPHNEMDGSNHRKMYDLSTMIEMSDKKDKSDINLEKANDRHNHSKMYGSSDTMERGDEEGKIDTDLEKANDRDKRGTFLFCLPCPWINHQNSSEEMDFSNHSKNYDLSLGAYDEESGITTYDDEEESGIDLKKEKEDDKEDKSLFCVLRSVCPV